MKKKVLLISNSPLVGAPENIAWAVNNYTDYEAKVVVISDYNGVRSGFFTHHSIVWDEKNIHIQEVIKSLVQNADIIQVHNLLDQWVYEFILQYANTDNFIYQIHSPMRESPLYFDQTIESDIIYKEKLTCAQYHATIYQDYTMVPLIVKEIPSLKLYNDDEPLRILYRPSHLGTQGRWNKKNSQYFSEVMSKFSNMPFFNIVSPNPMRPYELYELRTTCHITIDEVLTGTFHTISLEGLCAGNIVINNCDYFPELALKTVAKSNDNVPFLRANETTIEQKLLDLIRNPDKIRQMQKKSYQYYLDNLMPKDLVQNYTAVYNRLLGVDIC